MYDYSLKGQEGFCQKKQEKRRYRFLFYLAFFFILILFFGKSVKVKREVAVKPSPPSETKETLLAQIREKFENLKGAYSFYFFDLEKKEGFGINEKTIFTAASVNKIPILAALYYLTDNGEIDLDKKITLQKKDIQDYGTGILRYQKPGTTYSIKTLAQLMIEKSDNTASYILGELVIGLDKIQELVDSWGLTQTNMEKNKTSNFDMAILLTKMYQGEIANQALTSEMINFMDDSDFEDRLPALLPKNIKVYHKIGNEVGNIHDVGIVELPDNSYYVGLLTADLDEEERAKKMIAEISQLAFEYQQKTIEPSPLPEPE